MNDLAQIKADILKNNVCPNLAQKATQIVMGEGPVNANFVFIGEAPGKNEDIKGKPFVGSAGKKLDYYLAEVGLRRSDVYITNIVKYRPPNNRDPKPDEIKAFMPYLLRELSIIKPDVVVTLGRHAMNVFLPEAKISQDHGQLFEVNGYKVFPMYHPAALIYNQRLAKEMEKDFNNLIKYKVKGNGK